MVNMKMKHFILIFFLLALSINSLPVQAKDPVSEKKREKQKQQSKQTEQKEAISMPVDIDIPVEKTQQEIDEENAIQVNQKWKKYLSEKIAEMQQLFNNISQLDSNTITKESIEEYRIAVNNLKEKVDFKLGNDPLWKENDELDEMRALFSEIHARTLKKLKYWEEKIVPKTTTNKWILIGMILLAIMAIVPVFSQIKSAIAVRNAKKQTKKLMKQQQKEAEKQKLLADEDNIINIE